MSSVNQVVPRRRTVQLNEVLDQLSNAPVHQPFDEERLAFVAQLSRTLSRRGRGLPETQALAYWMRKAELHRLAEDFARNGSDDLILMPRGTVFHVPPANVDTIFVYSLVLSILSGNRNIVRLSSRATDQSNLLVDVLSEVLEDFPNLAHGTVMISYGHDDAVTTAISAACDVRIIWGGDATVDRIRSIPIPPHATELTFPDRFSMAAIGLDSYINLAPPERDELAERFFNDEYWFDQMGCSSARLLIWVGGDSDISYGEASTDFHARVLATIAAKNYTVDTSAAIAKISQSMQSIIDDHVEAYRPYNNTLTVLDVADFPAARGEFCGGGLFYEMRVRDLTALIPHITRADQTLATFGIPRADLRRLVTELRGRGIDRIVPIGQALSFNRFWDGYDILDSLIRRVAVQN